ncbi:hypothetical protein C6P45_000027 [Maudiozyma exigua]|uniref:Uncharacterized protein n=1 Tax=Maudiozyma exigua TaxID=34358 RepID=A0A9P6WFX0_MAUEX|nr:hypothetical protein C6P45_000027 [Kazachstania exigua]
MNLNNFDKFINWNGIYDLIDHGMWLAIVNGSIKNDTTLSFDLNRDQKAQLIVNYIDNKHVAFRGLGNESQIIYPNFHPNYAVRSLLQTIYNLLNLFKSLLKLFFRIRNYSTVHICGGSVHWYNNYNQNSNVIITYIIALIPKMNFDNRCNINISNNLKSQSFKHFQTSLIFKHYNRIDDTLTHFDIGPYWRVDFVYRFWIPRNKYNYANLWEISRVPTYFESS